VGTDAFVRPAKAKPSGPLGFIPTTRRNPSGTCFQARSAGTLEWYIRSAHG